MQLDKFDKSLTKYLEAITLTTTQEKQIDKAIEGVLSLALASFPDATVYAQGSFSTDTMAKPLTSKQGGGEAGEFDVDLAIEREAWDAAIGALDDTAEAVEGDDTFEGLTVDNTKNSCIRIEYPEDKTGVAFHIDLVPTKLDNGARSVPDRDNGSWKSSDAKRFAEWFNAKAEAEPGLRQVATILKRLRDLNDLTDNLKSIMVLTLAVNNYYANSSIMGDLLSVLDGIVTTLPDTKDAPFIANPVNNGENLALGIGDYRSVRSFIVSVRDKISAAVSDDNASALKEVFGIGFNYVAEVQNVASATTVAALPVRPTRAFGISDGTLDHER